MKNMYHIDIFVHSLSMEGFFVKRQISYEVGFFREARDLITSWLVCFLPKQAVRVPILARFIVLCSWARHFTLTVPLYTQVYWGPANLILGVTL